MTKMEHIKRHERLHVNLDELAADAIANAKMLPSKTTVMELMKWSSQQMVSPTHSPEWGGET